MKKKSFFQNKNRNQKWTEPEVGRPIDFADKYIEGDDASDKFDDKREDKKSPSALKAKRRTIGKRAVTGLCCLAIISIGFIAADVHIIRHASIERLVAAADIDDNAMAEVSLSAKALKTESIGLDNSVMLSSVIDESVNSGFSAVAFDAKRDDGTIGYLSSLALVDTFGAVSAPASQLADSVTAMLENDLLPIARISCYLDNIAPAKAGELALMKGDTLYQDKNGNTYLNPDSEAAYRYIKDIVQELSDSGINVFVLTNCDLPEEISENYGDGFETLSAKLNRDLGGSIRLLRETAVTITGTDAESGEVTVAGIKNDIAALTELSSNGIYYISTELDGTQLMSALEDAGVKCYMIEQ